MGAMWNIDFFLVFFLTPTLHTLALNGNNARNSSQRGTAELFLNPTSHRPYRSNLTPDDPNYGPVGVPSQSLSWPSSPEDIDRQGVIGEYTESEEITETSFENHYERRLTWRPTESPTYNITPRENIETVVFSPEKATQKPTPEQKLNFWSRKKMTGSILYPTQASQNEIAVTTQQNGRTFSHLPFFPSTPWQRKALEINPKSMVGSTTNAGSPSPPAWITEVSVSRLGGHNGLDDGTEQTLHNVTVSTKSTRDDSWNNNLHASEATPTVFLDSNNSTSVTPCKTTNQSWTPLDLEDSTQSLHPFLALGPPLVPLYSDWNSALATWGFAWEAHIYGLGSIFILFCLISVISLLGLPFRCPPGSLYITMLHFFIMAFAGIQAFSLLYDAYSSQDRLPPAVALLVSELPLPCLISAFSFAFLILSSHFRKRLSLPLALSCPFSILPKPCILLCASFFNFIVSLGCVGLLQLFHSLPPVLLLIPHVVFVCLCIILSFSYLFHCCLTKINTKHIYRLNDNAEEGRSPELIRSVKVTFSRLEDWKRATGAGIGTSVCLLGCGGLQLYGILHAFGVGGVKGYGFQPWPWWGYHLGCRLCESGVCLGLSIIGTHFLFCHNSSTKTLTSSRQGSWSRLSCNSPLRGQTLSTQDEVNSLVLPSQGKQDKLVICDLTNKQTEVLPLCSEVLAPANGVNGLHQAQRTLPLPTPPSPPLKAKSPIEPQLLSLDSLCVETDSTKDFRPPSPINLSRSIDQALFSESLFSHSIFGQQRLFHSSSSASLSAPGQGTINLGLSSVGHAFYRTSSCGDVEQENNVSNFQNSLPQGHLTSHSHLTVSPEKNNWKGSDTGSTQGLCSYPKDSGKSHTHSWGNRGQNFAQSSLQRGIPHLSYRRHYRTLSLASQDGQGGGKLAGTKHLSESRQLEWDLAVQAEFVNVCKQIDTLSVCSDTIEL
ncbi:proline-rich transmembrane protein 4-like [Oryzias latipes]|uniref:Proline rich transmembrane protein 4a n=1 Tax=Oryzias latipes TaxID=8090 RepID=A0A3B3IFD8_ORYLA|nr:proline-rich transmembrane protein 4-like [Oryzias latipes]